MIQNIQTLQSSIIEQAMSSNQGKSLTNDASFRDSLEAAKKLLTVTNEAEKEAQQLTYDFVTGANDNIHSLQIAQEKSSILLSFTLQVRNQLLDSYKEIMRLTI